MGFIILYYDKDCLNDLKQAVKPYNTEDDIRRVAITGIMTGTNLLIRAKIPDGVTVGLTIFKNNTSTTQNISLVGTGQYETYLKENLAFFEVGAIFGLRLATSQIDADVRIDYFKFY